MRSDAWIKWTELFWSYWLAVLNVVGVARLSLGYNFPWVGYNFGYNFSVANTEY